ncbi:hypothetical protein J0656_19415 [Muricauda ruestringensis]|uniref:Uncharacterized protein n=1 Tax=Flagellimonas aurea TaxID=2915619 RepID=A0ABS3G9U8_9FLAO|nr:hypothetical protein [Allomuricauda aurea]MBO0356195.1 hypothetical protein [Allomuricauda aurea]
MKALAIFFLNVFQNILGLTIGGLARNKATRNSYRSLSNVDKVKYLEKRRQQQGYQKGWLYHRCREEGLMDAYKNYLGFILQVKLMLLNSASVSTKGNMWRIFGKVIGNTSIGFLTRNG